MKNISSLHEYTCIQLDLIDKKNFPSLVNIYADGLITQVNIRSILIFTCLKHNSNTVSYA